MQTITINGHVYVRVSETVSETVTQPKAVTQAVTPKVLTRARRAEFLREMGLPSNLSTTQAREYLELAGDCERWVLPQGHVKAAIKARKG